jgi:hypothetical protein
MFDDFPNNLRIGPYTYSVEILDKLDDDETDGVAYGVHMHGIKIQFKREQKNKVWAADTVIHEILHGVFDNMGLDLPERDVSSIATSLTQVLRDSPKALAWIARTLAD